MSTLNVDALVGVSSANAITVRGEGSATTSLQQGLCKAWGTVVAQATVDSFNNSSDTDVAAGQFEHNFSNNCAAANYASVATNGSSSSVRTFTATNWYETAHYTTAKSRSGFYDEAGTAYTDTAFSVARFGDLA